MPGGTVVDRQFVLVLTDGMIVIDWGDGLYQEVDSGRFFDSTQVEDGFPVSDEVLLQLKRAGKVSSYNRHKAYFIGLPERNRSTIE